MADRGAGGIEVERLREALHECIRTAAECRRYLSPGLADLSYRTYRQVWDESMAAEIRAKEALGA